ncbi:RNA polymerase sigma factor FliA [Zhongshania aliphaticivorans]|uniref:RNA polymerase sigma factor FliA n=1 Tax=Zhongshania aliphaticivorans TaxID=1470434 RepID=A0A5S9NKE8_9GAMM|nr:RNA polymerase sigma factor FliA [Zhongshania aliphaticivorans]CAA0090643.1 RNA polymerase sigma factor FliA [Zhongshania aliphaticivorans]CAA0098141.1 RNA polymerase sigma factor FliA [Zhongshania aliphaticivorans]
MNGRSAYLNVQYGSREELVSRHAPLVKRIAYHLVSRLPASVEVDDLIQAGMIGLLEAGSNYEMDKGASFETFASIRVRGAMIDQMRQAGWAPRSVTRQLREMSEAVRSVEGRLGREANGQDIADEMNISLDEYHELLRDTSSVRLFSLDQMSEGENDTVVEVGGGDDRYAPLENVLEHDFQHALASQINSLPEREKLVMALYYENGLNLKEIGEVMEVSESRVCQIHSQAIVRLKGRLSDWTAA